MDCDVILAMAERVVDKGMFWPGNTVCGGVLTNGCSVNLLLEDCASISALVIRPPGPVPLILFKSIPCSRASFSATGLILIFSDTLSHAHHYLPLTSNIFSLQLYIMSLEKIPL